MASIVSTQLSEGEIERLKPVYHPVFEKGQSLIRTSLGNVTLPLAFEKYQQRIKNWQVRQDDVYALTFPKNGTTLIQELAWLLQNDCNFEEAKAVQLDLRCPFLDFSILTDFLQDEMPRFLQGNFLKTIEEMPSPRVIKSHLHLCLLPDGLLEKSKGVMCLRNPKDTIVSFYHHEKLVKGHGYTGDFPTYFGLFMDNLLFYSSYFEYVKEAWQRRHQPNVCLLFFEEMKKDLAPSIQKVAKFLGKDISDDMLGKLVDHLNFTKMKNNAAVNREDGVLNGFFNEGGHFMRKGEVGDWKNYFTDEMNKRMDEAIEKHFKPIGLKFQFE